jgi:4'-phosphopantetheinyl transferase EntD
LAEEALRTIARRLDIDVVVGARSIVSVDRSALHPVERCHIANSAEVRRREFASGRVLLRALIGEDVALPVGPDRRPVLPAGICASLAHDRDLVVAVVSRSSSVVALGVDLELERHLSPGEAQLVLRPEEQALDAGLVFCLKEAAFKAWSGAGGGRLLDHHDLMVEIDGSRFVASVPETQTTLTGGFSMVESAWIALVAAREQVCAQ